MLALLDIPFGAQPETAAAGLVGGLDRRLVLDQHAAGRKVGAGHMSQQVGGGGVRMLDQVDRGGADFAGVVRRNGRRHADRDTGRAVGEQVRKRARQNNGFGFLPVVGGAKIHRVLVDAGQHRLRDLGQARLGVPHRGRIIAVDVAKVALALDQRISRSEVLRHAHHGVVDRCVAVRVILAHHVAHDPGALLEAGRRVQAQLMHGVDQPPVHRLQPVPYVGQGARHDGRERIRQVAFRQRILELSVVDSADQIIRHVGSRCPLPDVP